MAKHAPNREERNEFSGLRKGWKKRPEQKRLAKTKKKADPKRAEKKNPRDRSSRGDSPPASRPDTKKALQRAAGYISVTKNGREVTLKRSRLRDTVPDPQKYNSEEVIFQGQKRYYITPKSGAKEKSAPEKVTVKGNSGNTYEVNRNLLRENDKNEGYTYERVNLNGETRYMITGEKAANTGVREFDALITEVQAKRPDMSQGDIRKALRTNPDSLRSTLHGIAAEECSRRTSGTLLRVLSWVSKDPKQKNLPDSTTLSKMNGRELLCTILALRSSGDETLKPGVTRVSLGNAELVLGAEKGEQWHTAAGPSIQTEKGQIVTPVYRNPEGSQIAALVGNGTPVASIQPAGVIVEAAASGTVLPDGKQKLIRPAQDGNVVIEGATARVYDAGNGNIAREYVQGEAAPVRIDYRDQQPVAKTLPPEEIMARGSITVEEAFRLRENQDLKALAADAWRDAGSVSRRYCLGEVTNRLIENGFRGSRIAPSAIEGAEVLRKDPRFIEIKDVDIDDVKHLPRGTVVIYEKPGFGLNAAGHAEIVTGENQAASDFRHRANIYGGKPGMVFAFLPVKPNGHGVTFEFK